MNFLSELHRKIWDICKSPHCLFFICLIYVVFLCGHWDGARFNLTDSWRQIQQMPSKCFHCTIKKIHHLFSSLLRKACPSTPYEGCSPWWEMAYSRAWKCCAGFTRRGNLAFGRLEFMALLPLLQTSQWTFSSARVIGGHWQDHRMFSQASPGMVFSWLVQIHGSHS